jgi:hypothetical protein
MKTKTIISGVVMVLLGGSVILAACQGEAFAQARPTDQPIGLMQPMQSQTPSPTPSPTIDYVPTQAFLVAGWATSAAEADMLRDDLAAKQAENQALINKSIADGALATSDSWNAQKAISDNNLEIAKINSTLTPDARKDAIALLAEQNKATEVSNKGEENKVKAKANELTERAQYIIGAALIVFFVLGVLALRRPRAAQSRPVQAAQSKVQDRTWERQGSTLKNITPPGNADDFLRFAIMVRNDPHRTLAKDQWEGGNSPYSRLTYMPVYTWLKDNKLMAWSDEPRGLFLNRDGETFFDEYIAERYRNSPPPQTELPQNSPPAAQTPENQTPETGKESGEGEEEPKP